MKQEDIEKAAGEYSGIVLGFKDNPVIMNKHKAFMDGAEWRINSVWHDAIDKPERNRDFLYESARGWFGINNTTKMAREIYPEKWDRFVEGYDVIRWVYIDDILPERKEETE